MDQIKKKIKFLVFVLTGLGLLSPLVGNQVLGGLTMGLGLLRRGLDGN